MSREIKADHTQLFLLPPSLEDWVPPGHPVRFVREIVLSLDLVGLGFKVRKPGESGAPNYSSELLLGVWLYGYMNRIRSSRRLERACLNEFPLIWLTGMNYPDHNTLWRFWRNNTGAIKKVFRQSVVIADKLELIGLVLQAVDGTKIKSGSSFDTSWSLKSLKDKLARIDKSLEEMDAAVKAAERDEVAVALLSAELQKQTVLRKEIVAAREALEKKGKKREHPGDPQAVDFGGQIGYNAQVVADDKKQIVVAAEVVAEENDSQQLSPMLDQALENQGAGPGENLADAGYDSAEQLHRATDNGHRILVNDSHASRKKDNPFHAHHFEYIPKKDVVICPKDRELHFERCKKDRKQKHTLHVYRCKNKDCPFREECSEDSRGKSIEIGPFSKARSEQAKKRSSFNSRLLLMQRAGIVEPVFAHIKHTMNFRRFSFRGLDKVDTQWKFICSVHNFLKIMKLWKQNPDCLAILIGS